MARLLTLKWPKYGQVIDPTAYIYIYVCVCFPAVSCFRFIWTWAFVWTFVGLSVWPQPPSPNHCQTSLRSNVWCSLPFLTLACVDHFQSHCSQPSKQFAVECSGHLVLAIASSTTRLKAFGGLDPAKVCADHLRTIQRIANLHGIFAISSMWRKQGMRTPIRPQ